MKRVYSLAFFRHSASAYEHPNCGEAQGRFFVNYLPSVIRAFHHCYRGWELRIAHDSRVTEYAYFESLKRMEAGGLLKLWHYGEAKTLCGFGGMMERFRPVFEADVEYVVCRDVDSLPMPREFRMVDEFIASGAMLHAIHDSKSHAGPLMGGTMGINAKTFRERTAHESIESLLEAGANLGLNWNRHGADQQFLNAIVYPALAVHTLIHSINCPPAGEPRVYLAMETRKVALQACAEDRLSNHVGGCYDAEAARRWYDENRPNVAIQSCEAQ